MFDPTILSIGPLFLPITLIALVFLIFASVWLTEKWSPERGYVHRTVSEWLPVLLLIALLVYKFAPALFNLKQVWQNPSTLLYSSGTDKSLALAVLLAGSWLGWKIVKSSHAWATADVVAVAGLLTVICYNFLFKDLGDMTSGWWGWDGGDYRYHPLHLYRFVLLLPLFIWVLRKWKQLDSGSVFPAIAIWIGIVYTLTSFVDYETGRLFYGLTLAQWGSILLAVAGWIVKVVKDRKKTAE